jgi:hypothetical protein
VSDVEQGPEDQVSAAPDPEEWGWIGEVGSDQLGQVAPVSLELLRRGEDWVNRRVLTVTLRDEKIARQQVSVDFRLPTALPGAANLGGRAVYLVPLIFLPRRSDLAFFDVLDEDGGRVPLLTRQENARLTGAILLTAAGRAFEAYNKEHGTKASASSRLETYLAAIPATQGAGGLIVEILDPSSHEVHSSPDAAQALLQDTAFLDLLGVCRSASVVHVPLETEPGERRIIKVCWEERWNSPDDGGASWRHLGYWGRRLGTWAGWRADARYLITPHVGSAESYHVQVAVPDGVELTQVAMRNDAPWTLIESLAPEASPLQPPPADPAVAERFQPQVARLATRAHLYVGRAYDHRAGVLWIALRATRHGFLAGAFVTSILASALLGTYVWRADAIVGETETAAAVLLLVPAIMATFLIGPGEHAMARHLLRGPRLVTAVVAVLPLLAAGGFVILPGERETSLLARLRGLPPDTHASSALDILLWLLFVAALVLCLVLGGSWRLPRPHRRRTPPIEHASRDAGEGSRARR